MTTPLICQGLSWFYHWKPHVLENHLVLGKKWNVWRLSPDYLFLQPISWNMDEVVNHLGQGYGRRSLDPCQLHAAQLPYQLPTFMWKLNQLCSLVKATSTFFPANLTHQASSLASFLAMMILSFSGIWQHLPWPCIWYLITGFFVVIYLITCLNFLSWKEVVWLREYGLGIRRSMFKSEFQHLQCEWS